MILKFFLFLIGFGLSTIGFIYIISYLNLLTIGYNFTDYVNFIIRRPECLNALLGLILMSIAILTGGKNELCIWYLLKL